jgi:glycosyltransferase involved in cell wall biosynthesis
LYAGSLTYIHGHSVGGTNPSLLRAMGAGASVLAYDVGFNREVADSTALYWKTPAALKELLEGAEASPAVARNRGSAGQNRVKERYTWQAVANEYENLCYSLVNGDSLALR